MDDVLEMGMRTQHKNQHKPSHSLYIYIYIYHIRYHTFMWGNTDTTAISTDTIAMQLRHYPPLPRLPQSHPLLRAYAEHVSRVIQHGSLTGVLGAGKRVSH